MDLPLEIWYIILDTLGECGQLRTHTNLCRALSINSCIGSKYRVKALLANRKLYESGKYEKILIDFWNKTGIDDGVPAKYLKENLDKDTRMYRTVWACDTLYSKDIDTFYLYSDPAYHFIGYNCILHLTNKVYIDNRIIDEVYDIGHKLDDNSIKRWIKNFKPIMGIRFRLDLDYEDC